jgi:hypothetical protein
MCSGGGGLAAAHGDDGGVRGDEISLVYTLGLRMVIEPTVAETTRPSWLTDREIAGGPWLAISIRLPGSTPLTTSAVQQAQSIEAETTSQIVATPDIACRAPRVGGRLCSGDAGMRCLAPTVSPSCGFAPNDFGAYRIRPLT